MPLVGAKRLGKGGQPGPSQDFQEVLHPERGFAQGAPLALKDPEKGVGQEVFPDQPFGELRKVVVGVEGQEFPAAKLLFGEILEVEGKDGLCFSPPGGGHHMAVVCIGELDFLHQAFVALY